MLVLIIVVILQSQSVNAKFIMGLIRETLSENQYKSDENKESTFMVEIY